MMALATSTPLAASDSALEITVTPFTITSTCVFGVVALATTM
jgi:hypothetical protein